MDPTHYPKNHLPRFNIKFYILYEIYIILVNTESFLQCNYLCMVQCVYGQEEKTENALWLLYIIYINIYKDKESFNTNLRNYTTKLG